MVAVDKWSERAVCPRPLAPLAAPSLNLPRPKRGRGQKRTLRKIVAEFVALGAEILFSVLAGLRNHRDVLYNL